MREAVRSEASVSIPIPMSSSSEDSVLHAFPSVGRSSRNGWLQTGLFVTILFAYLLADGRTPPYTDAQQIYGVAEALVYRNSIQLPVGNGTGYASHPFLTSVIHVPATALRWALARNNPELDRLLKPFASHFAGIVVASLGCLIFFRLLVYLGISALGASLATAVLAFGTFLPIYGRSPWSETSQATFFMGFYSALLRTRESPRCKTALFFGLWTGLLVNSKYLFVAVLPGAILFLAYEAWRTRRIREFARASLWALPTGLPLLALILWYNWARTGTSTGTGYPTATNLVVTVFRENLLFGLWSQFFSLGKNIFFYNPPLVLAVFALPYVARNHSKILWALIVTAGPVLILYGKFVYWSGDWCWGPRYLLFLVAPFLVLACLHFGEYHRLKYRILMAGWTAMFLVGVWVQIAGASQYWDHYIRVSKIVQGEWLGNPNRRGAYVADRSGQCDPCFEDYYARTYTPAFQPIEAHSWFLWHHLKSDPWLVAAKEMPLRRYTTLDFAILREWYERPPWDWWKLNFVGRYKATGNVLLAIFISGVFTGIGFLGYGLHHRRDASSATVGQGSTDS